jgi:hypothetical protein
LGSFEPKDENKEAKMNPIDPFPAEPEEKGVQPERPQAPKADEGNVPAILEGASEAGNDHSPESKGPSLPEKQKLNSDPKMPGEAGKDVVLFKKGHCSVQTVKSGRHPSAVRLHEQQGRSAPAAYIKRRIKGATNAFTGSSSYLGPWILRWWVFGLFLVSAATYAYVTDIASLLEEPEQMLLPALEGVMVAWFFYFFIIYIPKKRDAAFKNNIVLNSYQNFKENLIHEFLILSEGGSENSEKYLDLNAFRKKFAEKKWRQIAHSIDEKSLRQFRIKSHFLRDELVHVLNSIENKNSKSFFNIKNFLFAIIRNRRIAK